MSLAHLVILEADAEQVATELDTRLQTWNEARIGPRNTRRLAFSVRDHSGRLIGGLHGELHWNAFYLATLWVDDDHRRRGYGTALMERAEAETRARSCEVVFLTTLTFQAAGFYEKCGYTRFAELPYGTRDFGRIWYAKRLQPKP